MQRAESPLNADGGRSKRRKLLSLKKGLRSSSPVINANESVDNNLDHAAEIVTQRRSSASKEIIETAVDELLQCNDTSSKNTSEAVARKRASEDATSLITHAESNSYPSLTENDPFSIFDDDIRESFGCSNMNQSKPQGKRRNSHEGMHMYSFVKLFFWLVCW